MANRATELRPEYRAGHVCWRSQAEVFRKTGLPQQATMIDAILDDLEERDRIDAAQMVSCAEAAAQGGFNKRTIERMAREGKLAHTEGDNGQILVKLADIPVKARAAQPRLTRLRPVVMSSDDDSTRIRVPGARAQIRRVG